MKDYMKKQRREVEDEGTRIFNAVRGSLAAAMVAAVRAAEARAAAAKAEAASPAGRARRCRASFWRYLAS